MGTAGTLERAFAVVLVDSDTDLFLAKQRSGSASRFVLPDSARAGGKENAMGGASAA
jgi:hypothetical protein